MGKSDAGARALETASETGQWDIARRIAEHGAASERAMVLASRARQWDLLRQIACADRSLVQRTMITLAQAGEWTHFQKLAQDGVSCTTDFTQFVRVFCRVRTLVGIRSVMTSRNE